MQESLFPTQEKKEWRILFPPDVLEKAEKAVKSAYVKDLVTTADTASAVLEPKNGYRCEVRITAPKSYSDSWNDKKFHCDCLTKRRFYYRLNNRNLSSKVCHHEAAVLMLWEEEHGPWVFDEPPEIAEKRRREEEEQRKAKEREKQKKAEQARRKAEAAMRKAEEARRQAEKEKKKSRKLAAASLFPDEEADGTFYNLPYVLRSARTNEYAAEQLPALLANNAAKLSRVCEAYSPKGEPMLTAQGAVLDGERRYDVRLDLLADKLESHRCTCRQSYCYYDFYDYSDDLCEHELALLTALRTYIRQNNPGDATDRAASSFLEAMGRFSAAQENEQAEETPRPKSISLQPRLMLIDGELVLSYKIGPVGGKTVLLRSYQEFLYSYEEHLAFKLSKTSELDFGAFDLTDDSLPWLTFLQRRMSETEVANSTLLYSGALKVKTRDALTGAVLDRFYELAEGTAVEFSGHGQKDAGQLSVGHAALRVTLSTARIPKSGAMLGIEVSGKMPVILKGSAGSYMLTSDRLSRITKDEEQALRPFRAAADKNGGICFRIGREKLAEYYYRVVPQLRQSPYVDLEDICAEEAEGLLPPEPRFTFRMDRELRFSLMVLDEAQYIKNQKASMTKAVKAVNAELRFALTGTPIENRLTELWSIFDYLMPGFLYSYTEFSRRLETPITKQKDPAATERLKRMTSPFILRRLKADVLKDLPPKLEEVRYTRFDDEQRKIYDGQVVRMKQLVASSDGSGEDKLRLFAELTRIRQICCDPSLILEDYRGGSAKRDACLELVKSAMGGGHRMLVFSQFTSMLALLEEDLKAEGIPCFKLTGSTPKEQRLRLVREFNDGDTPVFLISLKAGGTGLNLTGADVVIHYDPWWNLAAQNQATDRAHRIGQQNQVTVYRIIVKDTIEERILALQEAKRDLAEAVLSGEGTSLASLSQEELLQLLG